ncbi:MAG: prepilin-type N-terminal cleavage/methylation domain-containing protein [Planctomycetota bacterium]
MKVSQNMAAGARAGFSLVELLAVIVIIGILVSVLVTSLGGADDGAKMRLTRVQLEQLATLADVYEREFGDYPPSQLPDQAGTVNGVNTGIEAFVAALWSRDYEAGGAVEADELSNVDGDSSKNRITDFPDRQLFEFVDAWGNPIVYFHHRDYEREQVYSVEDLETGEFFDQEVKAVKNPVTKRFYRSSRFQFRSAGPNGIFDALEDDLCDDVFSFDTDGARDR